MTHKRIFTCILLISFLLSFYSLSGCHSEWDGQVLPNSWRLLPNDYVIDHDDSFFNVEKKIAWKMDIYGKGEDGYSTHESTILPYLNSDSFFYTIGTYESRTDVIHEIIDLETCYSHFAENASEKAVTAATKVYHQIMTDLVNLLINEYPLQDEQILEIQKAYFYRKVEECKASYRDANFSSMDKNSISDRKSAMLTQLVDELSSTAVRDYENGKLTIEEACYLIHLCHDTGPGDEFPRYGVTLA